MKKLLNLLMLLFLMFNTSAQCPEGYVLIINSQAELDSFAIEFPDCTELKGVVSILESDVSDLSPFSNIERINGDFNILSNNNLESLAGLENLTATSILSLGDVNNIKDLKPLSNLVSTQGLRITACDNLESFDGLENLEECVGFMTLQDNPRLKNISAIENLVKLGGFFIINNDSLLRLPNFYDLEGPFGLPISFANSTLIIQDNDNLLSLKGLDSITDYGRLDIVDNSRLKSLDGLQGIKNHKFGTIWLDVSGNDSLVTLTGLEGLDSIFGIGTRGSIFIRDNPLLMNLDALSNLKYIEGEFIVDGNSNLTDLEGLSNLNVVKQDFIINENDNLSSLSGLDSLDYSLFNSLTITNCDNLSFCSVKSVCSALENNANINIELNSLGCNSDDEVVDLCLTSTDDYANPIVNFYPNPIINNLRFDNQSIYPIESVEVYNIIGEPVIVSIENNILNFSKVPSGVYFLNILINEKIQTYKLLKI